MMGLLVGNDFFPHLPSIHIHDDALPLLYSTYKKVLPTLDGYINESGYLNLARFEKFLAQLALNDKNSFMDKLEDEQFMESKRLRPTQDGGFEEGSAEEELVAFESSDIENDSEDNEEEKEKSDGAGDDDEAAFVSDHEKEDDVLGKSSGEEVIILMVSHFKRFPTMKHLNHNGELRFVRKLPGDDEIIVKDMSEEEKKQWQAHVNHQTERMMTRYAIEIAGKKDSNGKHIRPPIVWVRKFTGLVYETQAGKDGKEPTLKAVKQWSSPQASVPVLLPLVVKDVLLENSRLLADLPIRKAYPDQAVVWVTDPKLNLFGMPGMVAGYTKENTPDCLITIVGMINYNKVDLMEALRKKSEQKSLRWMGGYDWARQCQVDPRLFARITGMMFLWNEPRERVEKGQQLSSDSKINCGLSLKFSRRDICVADYTDRVEQTTGKGTMKVWIYSNLTCCLITEYKNAFPEVWRYLESAGSTQMDDVYYAEEIWKDEKVRNQRFGELKEFLNNLPSQEAEQFKCGTVYADRRMIGEIEKVIKMPPPFKPTMEKYYLKPSSLFRYELYDGKVQVDPEADFLVLDRVAVMSSETKVRKVVQGTVIGIHDDKIDVLFDFDMDGISKVRGSTLASAFRLPHNIVFVFQKQVEQVLESPPTQGKPVSLMELLGGGKKSQPPAPQILKKPEGSKSLDEIESKKKEEKKPVSILDQLTEAQKGPKNNKNQKNQKKEFQQKPNENQKNAKPSKPFKDQKNQNVPKYEILRKPSPPQNQSNRAFPVQAHKPYNHQQAQQKRFSPVQSQQNYQGQNKRFSPVQGQQQRFSPVPDQQQRRSPFDAQQQKGWSQPQGPAKKWPQSSSNVQQNRVSPVEGQRNQRFSPDQFNRGPPPNFPFGIPPLPIGNIPPQLLGMFPPMMPMGPGGMFPMNPMGMPGALQSPPQNYQQNMGYDGRRANPTLTDFKPAVISRRPNHRFTNQQPKVTMNTAPKTVTPPPAPSPEAVRKPAEVVEKQVEVVSAPEEKVKKPKAKKKSRLAINFSHPSSSN